MKTAVITIRSVDAACLRERLATAGIRYAIQHDGPTSQLITMQSEAKAIARVLGN